MERLSYVVIVMVYEMARFGKASASRWRWIVGMLIIDGACYRNSLTWGCEAVRDVLRLGFASAGVGVGAGYFGALCGFCSGKEGRFLAYGLA